jgi:hypothetical protein
MATVIYEPRMPSPLAGLPQAAGTLAEAIIRSKERQRLNQDYDLITQAITQAQQNRTGESFLPGEKDLLKTPDVIGAGQGGGMGFNATPTAAKSPFQNVIGQMKTPQGKALAVKLAWELANPKTNPLLVEQVKQKNRETLEARKEALRLKIEDLKDARQERQLTAQENRQLNYLEAMDRRLNKRLEAQRKGGLLTTAQQRANAEIDEARVELDKRGLSKEEIFKATQSTLTTGRENPDYNPAIAKLVNTARRRKYGDDADFSRYAWLPTLGKPGGGAGGPGGLAGFKGPGRYRINGKVVAIHSEDEFRNALK